MFLIPTGARQSASGDSLRKSLKTFHPVGPQPDKSPQIGEIEKNRFVSVLFWLSILMVVPEYRRHHLLFVF